MYTVLNVLVARAELVDASYRWRLRLRDAVAEMVLETAANGGADALVTFNALDFAAAAPRFSFDLIGPGNLPRRIT